MKRYNLSAEFVRWEEKANLDDQVDSFEYVVELESDIEAQQRLETLIIERMASKPGWTYKLITANFTEFESSSTLSDMDLLTEAINLEVHSDLIEQPELHNQQDQSIVSDQGIEETV